MPAYLPERACAHMQLGYLSQDDEQVPGRHGAVVAAAAATEDAAVADDSGFGLSDLGLERERERPSRRPIYSF